MAQIQPGAKFKLRNDFGNQNFDVAGLRHGFPAGTVGTVDEFVSAATVGAHNSDEDAYVLSFDDVASTVGPDGKLKKVPAARRCSFGVADFEAANPDRLFDEAGE